MSLEGYIVSKDNFDAVDALLRGSATRKGNTASSGSESFRRIDAALASSVQATSSPLQPAQIAPKAFDWKSYYNGGTSKLGAASHGYDYNPRSSSRLGAISHGYGGDSYYQERMAKQEEADAKVRSSFWNILGNGLAMQNSQYLPADQQLELARRQMQASNDFAAGLKESKEAAKAVEWDGRRELIEQYKAARSRYEMGGHLKSDYDEMQRLQAEIDAGDIRAGNGERSIDFGDRAKRAIASFGKTTGSGLIEFAADVGQAISRASVNQQLLSENQFLLDQMLGEDTMARYNQVNAAMDSEERQRVWNQMYSVADSLGEGAARDLSRAKNGLDAIGRAGVDIGVNILQMGFDAGVTALSMGTIPSLVPMFVRVAGESMRDARLEGVSLERRLAYGATKATIEVATEKMFDGVARLYGKGAMDDIVEVAIRRAATTDAGKSMLRLLAGASGEAVEEVVSSLLDPLAEAVKAGKIGKLDAEEMAYSAFIGFAIGFLGGGTQIASGENRAANAQNAAMSAMYEQTGTPSFRQEVRDRGILENLQSNPNYYQNMGVEENAEDAMRALNGKPSDAVRATELQNAAAQAAENQAAAREKELGVTRSADGRTVSRNGVDIKMPRTATQNTTFILLKQFSAEEAADIIANNKAYQEAFTEMTGLDLEGSKSEVRSRIEALFTRTNENASQSEDNSDHTDTPAEEQGAPEQASDELNSRPEEAAEQETPKEPRIGPKRGRDIARRAFAEDVIAQEEGREESNAQADVENDTFSEDFEAEDLRLQQDAAETARRVDAAEKRRAENASTRGPIGPTRAAQMDREANAESDGARAEAREAEAESANIEADESWDAAEDAAVQSERERQQNLEREQRKREGKLTDEDKAYYRSAAEAVRSDDTNKRLPKLAEWAKTWAKKWTPKKAFPGDKVSYHAQLANAIESFANGLISSRSMYEAYEALNSEDASANSKYFYEGDVAANLKNLAKLSDDIAGLVGETDVESEKLLADKMADYERLCEQCVKNLQTKMERLQEQYENRNELAWQLSMEARVTGHGLKQERATTIQRYLKTQSRVDTFFRFLGGFNKLGSKAWYKLADRTVDAERRFITTGYNARSYFYQIQTRSPELAKAWSQLESGKLMGNVEVPGIGKLSLNYELSLLRTLETPGGITHIAGHGAELAHEGDYYAGRNNNGWGNKQEDHEMIRDEDIRNLAEPYLNAADPKRPTFEEWQAAKEKALENLRDELKKDVMSFDIGKAAYEASQEAVKYLALEINKVSTRMFGYAKALNKDYYPLEEAASGNNAKSMSERAYNMDTPDFLVKRDPNSTQALKVTPFAETMMSYIQEASNWCAFGEMWSDLQMLDKSVDNAEEHQTITGMIGHAYDEYASKYLGDWEKVISNNRPKTSYANRLLGQIRKNIAQASLTLNPGVALKQTPSYYAAAGLIDMDILIKSRIMTGGPFRTARSYRNNRTVNEVNSRSGIVANRLAGYNTIEQGESLEATRSIGQKVISKLPKWLTNWITGRDVSTVSNLAVACAEQVKRSYPNLEVGSDEYYDAVTALLEEVVVKSQPIYDPQFRAEMLRSDSELLRSLAMFKTQPSQDFNQLYTAIGEYMAARQLDSEEGKAEAKAAKARLQKTIAGQIVAKAAFSALTMLADLITHRTKKYKWSSKDEKKDQEHKEGDWSARKFLTRFIFGTASSAASILWFGDTFAAVLADVVTGTNPFAEDTTEFYSISESTTALINDVIKAGITMAQAVGSDKNGWQKAKALKEAAAKFASLEGIPLQNAYNIINTIVMYELDTDQTKNFDHNDDFMRSMSNYSQMSETAIANKTMERVIQSYGKGKLSDAETLLATLNFESNKIISAVKAGVKAAYISGALSAARAKKLLKEYCKEDEESIEKLFADADREIAYNAAKEQNKKGFEAVEALVSAVTDRRREDDVPRDYYVVDEIVGSLLSDSEKDISISHELSKVFREGYNALRESGMKPAKAVEFLKAVDEDGNGTSSQEEMYKWYLLHRGDEKYVKALWSTRGYDKSWDAFKAGKKNMEYDAVSAERSGDKKFEALEEAAAKIKSDNSYQMQKASADAEIFAKIHSMDLNDQEYDAAVAKYISPDGRKMYNAARNEGYKPEAAVALIREIDSYETKSGKTNNGSLSIGEIMAYFKDHPDEEAVLKAIYYASTTSDKSWEEQKKKAKVA